MRVLVRLWIFFYNKLKNYYSNSTATNGNVIGRERAKSEVQSMSAARNVNEHYSI